MTKFGDKGYYDVRPNNNIAIKDLIKGLGWTNIMFLPLVDEEIVDWMKENFIDIESEVRWVNNICICFHRKEDAMAFTLRWT